MLSPPRDLPMSNDSLNQFLPFIEFADCLDPSLRSSGKANPAIRRPREGSAGDWRAARRGRANVEVREIRRPRFRRDGAITLNFPLIGESSCYRHYRSPVFCLLFTGTAPPRLFIAP